MDYEAISTRYQARYLTDKQLDGQGAAESEPEFTKNCVKVGWITQEQANAIRTGGMDPEKADLLAAIAVYEGGKQGWLI